MKIVNKFIINLQISLQINILNNKNNKKNKITLNKKFHNNKYKKEMRNINMIKKVIINTQEMDIDIIITIIMMIKEKDIKKIIITTEEIIIMEITINNIEEIDIIIEIDPREKNGQKRKKFKNMIKIIIIKIKTVQMKNISQQNVEQKSLNRNQAEDLIDIIMITRIDHKEILVIIKRLLMHNNEIIFKNV